MTPYQTAKAKRDALDAALCEAGNASTATRQRLADAMGIPAFTAMNLTPEPIRTHPDYVAARVCLNSAFDALRTFNAGYVKAFKSEIAQERRERAIS